MSRSLVALALTAFVLVGLAPVLLMFARLGPEDLARLVDARTLGLLGRTGALGSLAALVALALGLPFGFLVARTDVPGASLWRALGLLPLLLPPLLLAMSWSAMIPLRGLPMTALLLGAGSFPIVALFTARACERVDARAEESARLAGGARALLRLELPLVLPSALAGAGFAFVLAVNDFAVPDYISSVGPKHAVYADEIFASWRTEGDTARAVAVALPLIVLSALALVPALALRRRGSMAALVGDFRAPARLELGRWRWVALAFLLLALGFAALAPLARLAWEAGGGARGFSLANGGAAFARAFELARGNLRTSLLSALATALVSAPIALVLGHALARTRRTLLAEALLVLPLAVPAILFGIGNIALWNRPATGALYDSPAMVVLLCAGRYAPLATLAAATAVAMVERSGEESARLAGAGPVRTLGWIVAPKISGALLGGALLVYVFALRELDAVIFVPGANGTVLFRLYNAVHFGRDDFVAALALLTALFLVLPGLLWACFGRRRLEVLP